MSTYSHNSAKDYAPVSPIDITSAHRNVRTVGFVQTTDKEPRVTTRSIRTNSSSSTTASLSTPRKTRFAEATSVLSPISGDVRSPFADMTEKNPQPSDVGFGYIANNQPVEQHATLRSDLNPGGAPLKSALKTPGTASRLLDIRSPTFQEEQILEKQEEKTEKEQQKDLKVKTRVRMAKMVLRGVNFSCSLIVLAMLSTVLTIFKATKDLPSRNNFTAWSPGTPIWPQIVVLTIACVSLLFSIIVMAAYCRGGHRRAEKVAVYYTMFAVGWFMFSVVMWLVGAAVFHSAKANGNGNDIWGWSCKDNKRSDLFSDDVHYALVCRLQDWTLVCCVIEVVVEVIAIAIYGIVFYRFYSKHRLRKSMDARDRARSDLYLAQLRTQSAPNTPGFVAGSKSVYGAAGTPRTPHFPTQMRTEETADSPTQYANITPTSNQTSQAFKLQAPPIKIHHATPRMEHEGFPSPSISPPPQSMSPPPQERFNQHVEAAPGEQTYDAVPIPGAYETHRNAPGQAF